MSIDPSTIKPVSAATGKVVADAWFYLTDAPEVPERFTGEPFQPTGGWWTTMFHPSYGYSGPEVILYDDAGPAHFATYTPEDAPIWVPRWPDGWDLGVRIAADRHADGVER